MIHRMAKQLIVYVNPLHKKQSFSDDEKPKEINMIAIKKLLNYFFQENGK